MNVLISLVAFLVAVAILITFHEFGHFVVARLLGVKVLRFSVGFGRRLLRWQRGNGTEYAISALPFGGYVKLLDEREGPVAAQELARAFNRQPRWRRASILVAGPAFNLLLAAIAYWVVFMVGIPGLKPVIGKVPAGTPAARAGLVARDTIVSVNGKRTLTWDSTRFALLDAVVSERPLVVAVAGPSGNERTVRLDYGDSKALTQPDALLPGLGLSVWLPPLNPVIGKVMPGQPASRAGLAAGDRILAIDGAKLADWSDMQKTVEASPGKRLVFEVERRGHVYSLPVVPAARERTGRTEGIIGVDPREPPNYASSLQATEHYAPLPAASAAFGRTGEMTALTAVLLFRMATGGAALSNLGGPIDIAQYAGASAQAGVVPFLSFLAIISISLAILNLFPIPLLDGGQLLYVGIEFVRGRPLSERAEAIGQRIGLSLLAILIGFAIFNDLSRLVNPS